MKWTEPSAAELAMKSEPKAPGAPAVILSWEQSDDGDTGELTLHVRIKVLSPGGVSAGNIEIPSGFVKIGRQDFSDRFAARTIREDGTVMPFVATASSSFVEGNGRTRLRCRRCRWAASWSAYSTTKAGSRRLTRF